MGQPHARCELDEAAADFKEVLVDLIAHGGADLLVPNIPDVGITPELRTQGSEAAEEARTLRWWHAENTIDDVCACYGVPEDETRNVLALVHRLARAPTSQAPEATEDDSRLAFYRGLYGDEVQH
jgi:hypothetical protein